MERLNARLAELGPVPRTDIVRARWPIASMASFAALAAGIAAVAYLAVETNNYFTQPGDLRPVAATSLAAAEVAESEPAASISNAALVASVPTGIPVWPAVLMVGQSPIHFASMQFRDAEQTR
jgi:hypothetical protein